VINSVRRLLGHRIALGHKLFGPPNADEDGFHAVRTRQAGPEYTDRTFPSKLRSANSGGRSVGPGSLGGRPVLVGERAVASTGSYG
jgi:hypothetical protein